MYLPIMLYSKLNIIEFRFLFSVEATIAFLSCYEKYFTMSEKNSDITVLSKRVDDMAVGRTNLMLLRMANASIDNTFF